MAREYVPVPIEYLEEMALLSDEDFGVLMRALLRYGRDGTPITLGGDCRFYAVRVMNKDNHYADKAKREEEKKKKQSEQNSRNARARYDGSEGRAADGCGGERADANAGNTKPNQSNPDQTNPFQTKGVDGAEAEKNSASVPAQAAGETEKSDEEAVVRLPLSDGSEYGVRSADVAEWEKAYPAVDVLLELQQMRSWCLANPKQCKTGKGVKRFIVNWLAKEQDKGHPGMGSKGKKERVFVPTEFED